MIPDTLLANLTKSQKEKHQKHVAADVTHASI